MNELLVATTNPGKLREIVRSLDGIPIQLKTLVDFPGVPPAQETGASFADNARQKALHYAGLTGMVTLSEDSGFEVDALNREPGIYSARYLRENATYEERFADIYRRMKDSGARDRNARFVCALAVAFGRSVVFETRATVEGSVAVAPAGPNGFGYDPIFFYAPYRKTFGEVSEADKAAVSHRGQAMRALGLWLASARSYGRNEFLLD